METAALIPVSEYLKTTYRPDCDFVAGEVRERNIGEEAHAAIQAIFAGIFREFRHTWNIRVYTEVRVQTLPDHYRVPDLCVVSSTEPLGRIIHYAPLLCIEILSPTDRMSDMRERMDEYFDLGARAAWVIDPLNRVGYHASKRGFEQPADGVLRVEGTAIEVPLAGLFAELDESW
jgi:Uma2 family endonuclease